MHVQHVLSGEKEKKKKEKKKTSYAQHRVFQVKVYSFMCFWSDYYLSIWYKTHFPFMHLPAHHLSRTQKLTRSHIDTFASSQGGNLIGFLHYGDNFFLFFGVRFCFLSWIWFTNLCLVSMIQMQTKQERQTKTSRDRRR